MLPLFFFQRTCLIFLGVKGACMVGHGSSNALAIQNGITTTINTIESNVTELIAESVAAQRSQEN